MYRLAIKKLDNVFSINTYWINYWSFDTWNVNKKHD